MAFRIKFNFKKYQPLYTPLAIFAGCLLIAVVIYTSGGITITIGGGRKAAEGPAVAGEEEAQPGELDSFAKCLTEKGAKLYAHKGCGACQNQKDLFGTSFQYLNHVECADESSGGWSQACIEVLTPLPEAERGVPAWTFKDGSTATGVQTLEALSEKTGCPLQ